MDVVGCYVDTGGIERPNLNDLPPDHPLWAELDKTSVFRNFMAHTDAEFERKRQRDEEEVPTNYFFKTTPNSF